MDVPLNNEEPIQDGPTVQLPDNSTIAATYKGNLQLPKLPKASTVAYKFPNIRKSLLTMCDICDQGGTAIFNKHEMHATLNGKVILQGKRDYSTGLWLVPIANSVSTNKPEPSTVINKTNIASAVLEATNTKQELVRFHHATCFYPVKSTWIQAIENGNFATFPGLTADLVKKYLPLEIPTILGHQHQVRQGLRSTTAQAANVTLEEEPPVQELYATITPLTGLICTDQTGRFPVRSKSGNNYLFVMYDYDANAILGAAIPDRKTESLQSAFLKLFNTIKQKGYQPTLIRLDNEISHEHMHLLENKLHFKVQLVPHIITGKILQKGQYKHTRNTSLQD